MEINGTEHEAELQESDIQYDPNIAIEITNISKENDPLKCDLGCISRNLQNYEHLHECRHLTMECFQMVQFDWSQIPNVEFLNLTGSQISTIDLHQLPCLKCLNISDSAIVSIGAWPPFLEKLEAQEECFRCDEQQISGLEELLCLRHLAISDNIAEKLIFSNFSQLETLILTEYDAPLPIVETLTIPTEKAKREIALNLDGEELHGLRELRLHCSFNIINLQLMEKLRIFDISGGITEFLDINNLEQLIAVFARKTTVTQYINLTGLENLRYVNFSNAFVNEMRLQRAPRLHTAELRNGDIRSLDIDDLENLKRLDVFQAVIHTLYVRHNGDCQQMQFSQKSTLISNQLLGLIPYFAELTHLAISFCTRFPVKQLLGKENIALLIRALQSLKVLEIDHTTTFLAVDSILQELTVLKLTNVQDLSFVKNPLEKLEILQFHGNSPLNFTAKNGSNFPAVTCFESSGAPFESIDATTLHQLEYIKSASLLLDRLLIHNLQHLRFVNVESTHIREIYCEGLPKLRKLLLPVCGYRDIKLDLHPDLKELNLWENRIAHLDITGLHGLEEFRSYKNLVELKMGRHPRLRVFVLNSSRVETLDFSGSDELEMLQVTNSPLTSLTLGKVDHMQELNLAATRVAELSLAFMPALRLLNLSGTLISSLGNCLSAGVQQYLEELDVSGTPIAELGTGGLIGLHRLDVSFTAVSRLDLQRLSALTYLNISNSRLEDIYIEECNIRILRVSEFQISVLKRQLFPLLSRLHVDPNKRADYTDNGPTPVLLTPELANLQFLRISDTRIAAIDTRKMPNLHVLYAENVKIQYLDLRPLRHLEVLVISRKLRYYDFNSQNLLHCLNLKQEIPFYVDLRGNEYSGQKMECNIENGKDGLTMEAAGNSANNAVFAAQNNVEQYPILLEERYEFEEEE